MFVRCFWGQLTDRTHCGGTQITNFILLKSTQKQKGEKKQQTKCVLHKEPGSPCYLLAKDKNGPKTLQFLFLYFF